MEFDSALTLAQTLVTEPSLDERKWRLTALRDLLEAWRDPKSATGWRFGRSEFDQPQISVVVASDTIQPSFAMFSPLSAAKCMALAVLLDDDGAAAAALADYMVESGVEAFAAERERTRRLFDDAVWDIRWRYGAVPGNDAWIGWFRQRLFPETTP